MERFPAFGEVLCNFVTYFLTVVVLQISCQEEVCQYFKKKKKTLFLDVVERLHCYLDEKKY